MAALKFGFRLPLQIDSGVLYKLKSPLGQTYDFEL